jgi:hypothetical protein
MCAEPFVHGRKIGKQVVFDDRFLGCCLLSEPYTIVEGGVVI